MGTALRRVVEGLYGPSVRRLPGLDFGCAYRGADPAFRYGGDVVDVFRFGAGYTSLVVLDIAGHGLAAAQNAALIKYALRAFASSGLNVRDCVVALNRLCLENDAFEASEACFATVFFAIVQPDRRAMRYVSAGHDAAFLIAPGGARSLPATGPMIGVLDGDDAFEERFVRLGPGCVVVAVTDGFCEARNARGIFLGGDVLLDIARHHRANAAEGLAEAVTAYAYQYTGGRLHDDVAALVMKIVPEGRSG